MTPISNCPLNPSIWMSTGSSNMVRTHYMLPILLLKSLSNILPPFYSKSPDSSLVFNSHSVRSFSHPSVYLQPCKRFIGQKKIIIIMSFSYSKTSMGSSSLNYHMAGQTWYNLTTSTKQLWKQEKKKIKKRKGKKTQDTMKIRLAKCIEFLFALKPLELE